CASPPPFSPSHCHLLSLCSSFLCLLPRPPPRSTLFPYTTLFRSQQRSRNEETVNFVRSFKNTVNSRVTIHSLNFVFLHKSIPTVQLNSFIHYVIKQLTTCVFVHRTFDLIFCDCACNFASIF